MSTGRWSWFVVMAVNAMLLVYSLNWFFIGPDMALENIAERTPLVADAFRQGTPSAYDVISVVARQGAGFGVGLGLLGFIVALDGYRRRWARAWAASWAVVVAILGTGLGYFLVGGLAPQTIVYVGIAAVAAVALLLARSGATESGAASGQ